MAGRFDPPLAPHGGGGRPSVPDVIIYTDAATSSRIGAAVTVEPHLFRATKEFPAILSWISGPDRGAVFCEIDLI